MSKVVLNITEEILAKATPGDPCGCAIYRALKPQLPLSTGLRVDAADITLTNESIWKKQVPLPKDLVEYAYRFDHYHFVEPDRFELDIPDNFLC